MKGSTRRDILAVIHPVGSKSAPEKLVSSAKWNRGSAQLASRLHAPLISPAMVVVSSYLFGSQRSICEMPLLPASKLLQRAGREACQLRATKQAATEARTHL